MTAMIHNDPLRDAVLRGEAPLAESLAGERLTDGIAPETLLAESLIPAMDEVGRKFEEGEFFLPELLVAARAMKAAMALIQPRLAAAGNVDTRRAVIGTVAGDLHDIGKNLVGAMLEGGGFQVTDLGADVAPEAFVTAVRDGGAQILGISALLSTTMPNMKAVLTALEEAGLRRRVKVIVGGAPITAEYAAQIGADGYAPDASQAVSLARQLFPAAE